MNQFLMENGYIVAIVAAAAVALVNYFFPGLLTPELIQIMYSILGIGGLGAAGYTAKRAKRIAGMTAKQAGFSPHEYR